MKFLLRNLLLLWLCAPGTIIAQAPSLEMAITLSSSKKYPVRELAFELTKNSTTELKKLKSIFDWITTNIDYRVKTRKLPPLPAEEDDDLPLLSLEERVGEQVLKSKEATCFGYAKLFKSLCDYSGIKNEIITGYVRSNMPGSRTFGCNHNWNAVWIDSSWHLMDVTWASGFISYDGERFIKSYDSRFFMADPIAFSYDHVPDDPMWALCKPAPAPEFKRSPYHQKSFNKYNIGNYFPESGTILASVGDTLNFQVALKDPQKDKLIGSDPFLDTLQYMNESVRLVRFDTTNTTGNAQYIIDSGTIEWIFLLYNNDIILRYRLRLKQTSG